MSGLALSVPVLLTLGACIALEIAAQLSFKIASNRAEAAAGPAIAQPMLWCGIAVASVEIVCWVVVLQSAPLTVAFPIMTLTYVGIPVASLALLKEKLAPRQLAGAALVAAGVLCVALSGA